MFISVINVSYCSYWWPLLLLCDRSLRREEEEMAKCERITRKRRRANDGGAVMKRTMAGLFWRVDIEVR